MTDSRAPTARRVNGSVDPMAVAYNNFGFRQLTDRRLDAALDAFQRARDLGFDQLELLDANLGSCCYMCGSPRAAQVYFERCLDTHTFASPCLLHVISGDRLMLVSVPSAEVYRQLMATNGAWSAHSAGRQGDAMRLLSQAEANIAPLEDENLAASLLSLKAELLASG